MPEKIKQFTPKADFLVNALGQKCPMPILNLRDQLDEAKIGQTVELIADDIGAKADVPAFCKRTGQELLRTWDEGRSLHFLIKKSK
jgi:tRNA 2-thiouridine synthesizing protein A